MSVAPLRLPDTLAVQTKSGLVTVRHLGDGANQACPQRNFFFVVGLPVMRQKCGSNQADDSLLFGFASPKGTKRVSYRGVETLRESELVIAAIVSLASPAEIV